MDKIVFCILFIISIGLSYYADKKNKKGIIILPIAILSLIAGLRAETVGTDTSSYVYSIMNGFPYSWMFPEEGFRLVSNYLFQVSNNYSVVLLAFAIITNALVLIRLWDFRSSSSFSFMVFFYIAVYYFNSMNIMRQYVAMAILFYATRFLEKKNYIPFTILWVLSITIHTTSVLGIIFLIMYFWNNLSKKQKLYLLVPLTVISIIAFRYILIMQNEHIENYFSQKTSNINISYFYRLFAVLLLLYLDHSHKRLVFGHSTKRNLYSANEDTITEKNNIKFYYILGIALSTFGMFLLYMSRIGLYFLIFEPVFWGNEIKTGRNKQVALILSFIYAMFVFYHQLILNDCLVFPYVMHLI